MIDIGWLAEHGPCKIIPAGRTIACIGSSDEQEKAMYILLVGRVDVTGARGIASAAISLFPGDVFGGREFFTEKVENIYTAVVDSVVYVINEESFNDLSWAQPDILFEVLRAAYMPSGRSTAQVKIAEEKAASVASAKAKAVAGNKIAQRIQAPKEKKGAQEAVAAEGAAITPDAGTAAEVSVETAAPLLMVKNDGGIFPEGHKLYPGVKIAQNMSLVYEKSYTCPLCKKEFGDFKVFTSKLYESAPMRYDLRKYYTDFQPEWFDVITCRHCYFSTIQNYYADPKPILKQKIEGGLAAARESVLLDFEAQRNIDFVFAVHYLALLCADGFLSYAIPLRAKIWGNLSWLYEDAGDAEMERFAAAKAAAAYGEVYTSTHMSPIQEQTTCLSIAGMQRRAGIDRDMKKYLYQVKTVKMGDKAYIKIAEDIMDEIRSGN